MAILSQLAARHQQIQKAMPRRKAPVVNAHRLAAATAARAMYRARTRR
jgi:hypothetical protein